MAENKSSHRNRYAGEAFEKYVITKFKELNLFPDLGRSAELDPELDAMGIDLITVNRDDVSFDYAIQCKNTTKPVDYAQLLDKLTELNCGVPVLYTRRTKGNESNRFVTTGEYAMMNADDLLKIMGDLEKYKRAYEEFNTYFDSVHPDQQPKLNAFLNGLGL
tara:strand:+ start:5782 stop:6267 length:486 start_codon:yes stop_codon:yes gene_type:complete